MRPLDEEEVREAARSFGIAGELLGIERLERGHIHDTFVSSWDGDAGHRRFLHQRMNDEVFRDLDQLMHNVRRVTEHMSDHAFDLPGVHDDSFEPLRLVPADGDHDYLRTASGAWRTFHFIEGTESHDRPSGPEQAFEAARAFGWFQRRLADLPASDLGETSPDFFSAPHRSRQFEAASAAAPPERLAGARAEIEFAAERASLVGRVEDRLAAGAFPRRIVHGDTKLNNVLFDVASGRPRGIVDLDTCMPGWSLYDFGDLVRFTAATSSEDETDLDLVGTDVELYRALRDGYLDEAAAFLSAEELGLLPLAARLVTFTIGLRFLTDHLAGDVYFKVHREHHNLDRARVQFGMVRFQEAHAAAFEL